MNLYIDDIRTCPAGFDCVRSSWDAIQYMVDNGCPEYISFDHDLGGDDTSIAVINWMIEEDLDFPGFIPDNFTYNVHSANPVGAGNIIGKLNSYLNQR